jgi:hypothetical protein
MRSVTHDSTDILTMLIQSTPGASKLHAIVHTQVSWPKQRKTGATDLDLVVASLAVADVVNWTL